MKKNDYILNDLKRALKQTGSISMKPAASQTIKGQIIREFAEATKNNAQRYNYTAGGFKLKSLMQKPMIPIIAAIILILSGTGTALAADHAQPGDALFGIDRALEQVRLNFTFGETNQAKARQRIAVERDQELQNLEQQNGETNEPIRNQAQERANNAYQDAEQALEQAREQQSAQNQSQAEQELNKVEQELEPLRLRYENQEQTQNQGEIKSIRVQEQNNPNEQAGGTPNENTNSEKPSNQNMNTNTNMNANQQRINDNINTNTGNSVDAQPQSQKKSL